MIHDFEQCEKYYDYVQQWDAKQETTYFVVILLAGIESIRIANYIRGKGYGVKLRKGKEFVEMEVARKP
jgi:hypothetical protein